MEKKMTYKEQKEFVRRELKEKEKELKKALSVEKEALGTIAAKHRMAISRKHLLLADVATWEKREEGYRSFQTADPHYARQCTLGDGGSLSFTCHEEWPTNPIKPGRSSRRTGTYQDISGTLHFGPNEIDERQRFLRRRGQPDTVVASPAAKEWVLSHNKAEVSRNVLGHGCPTLPDLNLLKYRSSRRTRWYTDYEGKRIMVDACDFPEHFRCFR